MNQRRILRIAVGIAAVVICCFVALLWYVAHANQSAERRAREFCDAISIGSDISVHTARANDGKILWVSKGGYTFYFSGFIFDKAVCEVSVSKEGRVTSKTAEMEYD